MSRAGVARLAAVLAWVVATSALAAFGGKTFDAPLCVRQDGVLIGCRPFLDLSGATCTDTPSLAEVACTVTGAGPGGSPIAVDLGANGSNETAALAKVTTTNDLVTPIFSVAGTTLNFDVGKKWPACTAADTATLASDLTCADCVTLGTETTGNYVADVAQGTGITVTGAAGEGATKTVALTTPVALGNGGTGQTTKQAAFDALSPLSATGDILLFTGGHNAALIANATATKKYLQSASGVTAYAQVDYGDLTTVPSTFSPSAHNLLSSAHGDTTAGTVARGDLVTGQGVSPTWSRLAKPAASATAALAFDGTDVAWAATSTNGEVLRRSGGVVGFGAVDLTNASAVTGALALGNGGTGQATKAAAFDALAPTTTRGDLITRGASSNGRLGIGGANLYPKSNGTDVVYSTLAAGGVGSCTNQFVRTLNADATPTCNSVAATDFASSTDPFGGLYTKLTGRNAGGNDTLLSTSTTGKLWGSHTTGQGITILPNDVDATGDINLDGESILRPAWPDPAGTTSYLQRFTRTQTVTGGSPQLYGYDFAPTLTWSATGLCTGGTGTCTGAGNANQGAGCACTANANCNSGDCRGTGTMVVFHQGGTYTLTGANPSNIQFQSALRADYTVKSSTANVGPWLPDTILETWSSQMDTATATSPTQYIATHLSWIPSITAINGGKYYMGAVSCASDPTSGMAAIYGGGTVSSAGSGGDICVPRRSLVWDIGSNVSTASGSTATLVKDSTVYSKDRTKWANTTALSVVDSDLTAAAGKYDLHLVGGAQSVIAGNLRVGSTSDPSATLDVTGTASVSTSLTTPTVIGGTATNATLALQASSSATPTTDSTIVLAPTTRTIPNGTIAVATSLLSDPATITLAGANTLYNVVSIGIPAGSNIVSHANWTASANVGNGLGGGILWIFAPKIQNTAGSAQTLGTWQLFQNASVIDCNGGGAGTACSSGDVSGMSLKQAYTSTSSGALTVPNHYLGFDNTSVGAGSVVTNWEDVVSAPANSGTITSRTGLDFRAAGGGANPTQIGLNVGALTSTGGITEASAVTSAVTSGSNKYFLHDTGGAQSFLTGKFTTYNNQAVQGFGLPGLVAEGISGAQTTGTVTILTFPPAASGRYRVSVSLTTTSGTNSGTLQATLDYKDSQGATHSGDVIPLVDAAGAVAASKTSAVSKEFHAIPWEFTANTGTSIVLKVIGGATVNYTAAYALEQLG